MVKYGDLNRAHRPERFFKTGQLVRFDPPPGAYSKSSEQHHRRNQTGIVYRIWADDRAEVLFGRILITTNTAYLQIEEKP